MSLYDMGLVGPGGSIYFSLDLEKKLDLAQSAVSPNNNEQYPNG